MLMGDKSMTFLWKMPNVVKNNSFLKKCEWITPKSFFSNLKIPPIIGVETDFAVIIHCASVILMIHVASFHNKEKVSNSKCALELSAECSDVFGTQLWTF